MYLKYREEYFLGPWPVSSVQRSISLCPISEGPLLEVPLCLRLTKIVLSHKNYVTCRYQPDLHARFECPAVVFK